MDISTSNTLLNTNIQTGQAASESNPPLNAFGIGRQNQPEVELSAQARILQQNEQSQNRLQPTLDERQEQQRPENTTSFVRVSSSVGTSQRNNLNSEQAAEVYRTIQELL